MGIPTALKKLVPSFQVLANGTVTISFADLKALFPSLVIPGTNPGVEANLKMSLADLRKILPVLLTNVHVDESWYFAQVPGLRSDIAQGKFKSAAEHYYQHGYLEGRLPEKPIVDEKLYLKENEDVAEAVKTGKFKSGYEHFVADGYREGRRPVDNTHGGPPRPKIPKPKR